MLGQLIPKGGGDPIPLLKDKLLVGRRESCDIVLRFANVSAHHCEILFKSGYLFIRDLQSRNGVKVNGVKVMEKRVDPGDELCIAKHRYEVSYSPYDLGAVGPPPSEGGDRAVMQESLLARAGLERGPKEKPEDKRAKRYDPLDDREGQIELPDSPL